MNTEKCVDSEHVIFSDDKVCACGEVDREGNPSSAVMLVDQRLIDDWIQENPEQYDDILRSSGSGIAIGLASKTLSVFVIMGLIFRISFSTILIYMLISIPLVIYRSTVGAKKKAKAKIRKLILDDDKQLKKIYDQEILASGIGGKVPDWVIQTILALFVIFIIVSIIASNLA